MTDRESPRQGGPSPAFHPDDSPVDNQPWLPIHLEWLGLPEPRITDAPFPKKRTVETCHQFKLRLVSRLDGKIVSYTKPCNSWDCPECGPRRVQELAQHMARKWGWHGKGPPIEKLYWASFTTEALNRVSQRLVRKPGPWLKIFRGDLVHMYAIRPIGGTKEPRVWHELNPDDAINWLVRASLALPGVTSASGRNGWETGSIKGSTGIFASYGRFSDEDWDEAVEATVESIYKDTGIRVTPGEPLPDGVEVEQLMTLLTAHLTGEPV